VKRKKLDSGGSLNLSWLRLILLLCLSLILGWRGFNGLFNDVSQTGDSEDFNIRSLVQMGSLRLLLFTGVLRLRLNSR
jgi:hypothetical protein